MTVQPFGKNDGRYNGETIDIRAVLRDVEQAAAAANWVRDAEGDFVAYRRQPASARLNLYVSTGIHGDEPAGPLAGLQLMRDNRWPADAALWFCPCLNPTGFTLNRRENFQGIDLNRDYRHLESTEIRTHVSWLRRQPKFDLAICLHEDWEARGFYIYEVNPNNLPSFAEKVIEAVSRVCPIEEASLIDDWDARAGIIRPDINPEERPRWAEALYLIVNQSRQNYTMEAPSDYPMATRVAALVTAVQTVSALI